MSCRFAHDDAAYVLGALSPTERLEFERHLATCEECTRAVRELAGLPGLLGRVDASVLEQPAAEPPVPSTLLPALSHEVLRRRRRRHLTAAGLAAAVVTVVAVGGPVVVSSGSGDADSSPGAAPSSATSGTPSRTPSRTPTRPPASVPSDGAPDRRMAPVGDVPVAATIGLEEVAWGTRLRLTCTYEPQSVEYGPPAAAEYDLVVRTRAGTTEKVGSWRSAGGTTMEVAAATASRPDQIASVEVRTTDGRVVLRLRA